MKRSLAIALLIVAVSVSPVNSLGLPEPRGVPASPGTLDSLGISKDQHRRLRSGAVVVLEVLPPGSGARAAQGGTAVSLVHASPGAVWQLLTDYPAHAGLYPRVTTAEVLESDAEHALVRYVIGVGPFSFRFHVDNYADAGRRRLVWQLAAGHANGLFTENWGYWQVEPHAEGALLAYAIAARTVLPPFLTRGAERDGLVDTIRAVKDRAERGS